MLKNYLRILYVFLALLCYSGLYAQNPSDSIDQRVVEMYGQNRLNELLRDQPDYVDYLNYYVQNAFQVLNDVPDYKLIDTPDISELRYLNTGEPVEFIGIESLNILLISLKRKNHEYFTYKIGNTGKAIVFIAPQDILADYNTSKRVKARK